MFALLVAMTASNVGAPPESSMIFFMGSPTSAAAPPARLATYIISPPTEAE